MPLELTAAELAFLNEALDAARQGRTERLVEWIEAGLPVNLAAGTGDTLLILAAYHEHPATVQALLRLGADTGRVNDNGQTALAAAVFRQSRPTVSALLLAGADPERGERSAVAIARFFGLTEMAEMLGDATT